MATSMSSYPVGTAIQKQSLKPHYTCNKTECKRELEEVHGIYPNSDLSVEELRVLLRGARVQSGMINDKKAGKTTEIMDQIKSANLGALKEMCADNLITHSNNPTVGELRMLLRAYVVETGETDTEMTIGKHKGERFLTIMESDMDYCHWAIREVASSTGPDWRLVRFARWCEKAFNEDMTNSEVDSREWMHIKEQDLDATEVSTRAKAILTMNSPNKNRPSGSPSTASGSSYPAKQDETKDLRETMAKMQEENRSLQQLVKNLQEQLSEKKSKR